MITGLGGDDTLDGRSGEDRLYGGAGSDVLLDGTGFDNFWSGPGADSFVLNQDGIRDFVRDFEIGLDVIDVSALGASSFDDLSISNQTNAGGQTNWVNVIGPNGSLEAGIRFGDGTPLDASALSAADFIFAPEPIEVVDSVGFDDITGQLGAEVFRMADDGIRDLVRDFERGLDLIDVSALGVERYDQLIIENQYNWANAVNWVNVTDHTGVLEFGLRFDGQTVLDASNLTADNFLFSDGPLAPIIVEDSVGFDDHPGELGPEVYQMADDDIRDLIRAFQFGIDQIDVAGWGASSFQDITVTNELRSNGSVNWVRISDQEGNAEIAVRFGDGTPLDASAFAAEDFIFA